MAKLRQYILIIVVASVLLGRCRILCRVVNGVDTDARITAALDEQVNRLVQRQERKSTCSKNGLTTCVFNRKI